MSPQLSGRPPIYSQYIQEFTGEKTPKYVDIILFSITLKFSPDFLLHCLLCKMLLSGKCNYAFSRLLSYPPSREAQCFLPQLRTLLASCSTGPSNLCAGSGAKQATPSFVVSLAPPPERSPSQGCPARPHQYSFLSPHSTVDSGLLSCRGCRPLAVAPLRARTSCYSELQGLARLPATTRRFPQI